MIQRFSKWPLGGILLKLSKRKRGFEVKNCVSCKEIREMEPKIFKFRVVKIPQGMEASQKGGAWKISNSWKYRFCC